MQHEEHDPRHPQHRDRHRHPRDYQRPPYEHFNDSGSRWGEPTPPLDLHHRHDWQPREEGRFEHEGRFHHEEWRPNEAQRFPQQQRQRHENEHHHREPIWRQRDVHFVPSNQRVEDRWSEDPTMPHPNRRTPRHYDGFWQDYED